ncbi:MAG: hypothetical protein K2F84_07750, partial [Bacteroidales bacterium]|nr:hypothetical protein [Bacteroidales bacterium]
MFGLHREAELAEEEALRQQEREVRMAEVEAARQEEEAAAQAAAEKAAAEAQPEEKEEKPKRKLFDWTQTTKEMLVKWVKDVDEDDELN